MRLVDTRRYAFLFLIIALLTMVAVHAQADEGVRATLAPDRGELTVGDPVQLTLEVDHPAGYQVIIPQLDGMWGDFEIRNQTQAITTSNDDGTETTRQTIEATLFNLGEFQTPELPLTISDGVGGVTELAAPSASLSVNATLAEDDNELRDIKPQAGLALPSIWPRILGGLAAALVIGTVGWWAYRRWQGKPFGPAPAIDNRPPWQVAFDELARIEGLGLLGQGKFKEHYTLVTDCLRTYLERQFDLRVFERTTMELKPILGQSDLDPAHSRRFLTLFADSDLVKFARFTPDLESARQISVEARALVEATRPKPEESAEGQPPATPVVTRQLSYQSGQ